jgi:hypothetical protein
MSTAGFLKQRSWALLCHRRELFICGETNFPLNLGIWEVKWSYVLRTVIDVFQVGVFLDIDADPPAVEEHHQDGDVLRNEEEKKAT